MSEETKLYPLTNSQKGLWYTEQFYPGTAIGNIVASTSLKETIDYGKLAIAVNLFIKRHDGMRLRITDNNLEPEQYIAEYQEKEFEYIDFSVQGGREAFYKWADIEAQVPFQLINSDLFHFCLFKISENEGGVFARIHHLISDAWTMALMCNEIGSSYKMLVNEGTIPDGNPPSYIDFIKSEQDFEKSIEFKSAKQFWDNLFDTIPETAALKPRREYTASTQAKRNNFNVNKELTHKIIQYSNRNKVSGFILFLSALSIYINRVTGKEDIIIGIPVLLRPTLKEQVTVGMFIDTVPVRLKIDQNLSCEKYITWVSQVWKEIRKHRYPYNRLLHDIRKKHHTQEMLYDIVLSYHKARVFLPGDLEACWFFSYSQTNSLCISVSDHENTGNLTIDVDYLAELFEEREIQQINDGLLTIIEDMVGNPGKKPSELEIISEQEKEQQLYEFNDTQSDYPRGKTIHELFAEQVGKTPDKTAVVFEDKNLSYRELNDKASCLAKVLREKGVQPGEIVGLMVPRSLEMITGILAILKAGGAYLPIDTDYPPERIEYMLEDSGARLLLAQAGLMDRINFNGEILLIDGLNLDNGNNSNPANLNQPSDLAYLIYTSGSTGKPKGAVISHTNVVRLIKNSNTAFDFNDQDVWTLFHSIAFDFSVWEMYGALLSGSTLVVVPKDITRDPAAFAKLLKSEGVTVLNQTPSAFYALLNEEEYKRLPGIRYVIFGGEALQPGKLKEWRKHHPETKLINMYGITETTVHVTYKEIQDHEIESNSANIGKPLPTTSVYIMDARQNLLPIGCAGEICVGGLGVGRGYLNRPELTEEKYICNPYIPKETIYRSGDLARWQADGTLEYLGRIDHQVKIRGYRIELGEIENCLLAWAVIKEAVVIDRNDADGDKYLCAYYVSESELPVTELRSHLAQALPHYMIPSYFIRLGELPLTPNGKIDRKALPGPEGKNNITADYVPPANDTEEILCRIWSEVLGIEKIGVFDNFFDLGGHSLKVTSLILRMNKELSIDIMPRQIYSTPTIRELLLQISDYPCKKQNRSNENMICLKKGSKENKNVFLIHDGSGEIGQYSELCKLLSSDITCWGISFQQPAGYLPIKTRVEELAGKYIISIKEIQADGPYHIVGGCIGGIIAYEAVSQLEIHGDQVGLLALMDSPAPEKVMNDINFNIDAEKRLINYLFTDPDLNKEMNQIKEIGKLWEVTVERLQGKPEVLKNARKRLPAPIARMRQFTETDLAGFVYYLCVNRILNDAVSSYAPSRRVKAPVYYFEAINDNIIRDQTANLKNWELCCQNKLNRIIAVTNHFEMYNLPDIKKLVNLLEDRMLGGKQAKY
ncbi:MAG: amino acid adenylation domain-containing protein [Syntrophomonadaceae bacterium]|nr:amino acid adenylation domain-containing protein [Syntrophomonadaceae bacterium]